VSSLLLIILCIAGCCHLSYLMMCDCPIYFEGLMTTAGAAVVFTARRAYIARTMPWQDTCICLSVCLSVRHTPVLCVNGYTYPQSFSPSGSPTVLVFSYQTGWQYFDGDPPKGGVECKGCEKITIFDQCLALSRS